MTPHTHAELMPLIERRVVCAEDVEGLAPLMEQHEACGTDVNSAALSATDIDKCSEGVFSAQIGRVDEDEVLRLELAMGRDLERRFEVKRKSVRNKNKNLNPCVRCKETKVKVCLLLNLIVSFRCNEMKLLPCLQCLRLSPGDGTCERCKLKGVPGCLPDNLVPAPASFNLPIPRGHRDEETLIAEGRNESTKVLQVGSRSKDIREVASPGEHRDTGGIEARKRVSHRDRYGVRVDAISLESRRDSRQIHPPILMSNAESPRRTSGEEPAPHILPKSTSRRNEQSWNGSNVNVTRVGHLRIAPPFENRNFEEEEANCGCGQVKCSKERGHHAPSEDCDVSGSRVSPQGCPVSRCGAEVRKRSLDVDRDRDWGMRPQCSTSTGASTPRPTQQRMKRCIQARRPGHRVYASVSSPESYIGSGPRYGAPSANGEVATTLSPKLLTAQDGYGVIDDDADDGTWLSSESDSDSRRSWSPVSPLAPIVLLLPSASHERNFGRDRCVEAARDGMEEEMLTSVS